MQISIIIPAWHEEKTIVKTLDALKQMNYPLKQCELIITASADDSTYSIAKRKSMPEFGKYLVLKQKPGGKNAALQQGIRKSKGEIIVLLDADTIVDKEWLFELTKLIKSGKVVCANGNEFPSDKSLLNNYFMIEKAYSRQFLNQQSTHGPGGIAFKREILKKIGIGALFDKNIKAGVDYYLGERILEDNNKIYFAEKAKTRTPYNKTLNGFIKDSLRWKKAYSSLISKQAVFKILVFNISIITSFIIFLLAALSGYKLIFYLPFVAYASYSLFQCLASAFISSKASLFFYFPVYLGINIIDRTLTIYVFIRKLIGLEFSQNTYFKGER